MRWASKPRRRAGCPGRAGGPACSPPRRVQCRCLCAIVPHTHELSTGNRDGEAKQGHRGWRDGTDAQGGKQRARGSAQVEIAGWESKERRWRPQSCAERNVKGGAMQILPPTGSASHSPDRCWLAAASEQLADTCCSGGTCARRAPEMPRKKESRVEEKSASCNGRAHANLARPPPAQLSACGAGRPRAAARQRAHTQHALFKLLTVR